MHNFATLEEVQKFADNLTRQELLAELSELYEHVNIKAPMKELRNLFVDFYAEDFNQFNHASEIVENLDEPEDDSETDDHDVDNDVNDVDDVDNLNKTDALSQPQPTPKTEKKSRNKALSPQDVNTERAYKRLWKLFEALGLQTDEQQNAFVKATQEWHFNLKNRAKKRGRPSIIQNFVEYIQKHPESMQETIDQLTQIDPNMVQKLIECLKNQ